MGADVGINLAEETGFPYGVSPRLLPEGDQDEDCLTVGILAPKTSKTNLPVVIWVYGGAWIGGGAYTPYYIPSPWVERTQEHIVVALQYRTAIWGFPGSAALREQNLGLLDARAAIEWTYNNIAAFGGDPDGAQ